MITTKNLKEEYENFFQQQKYFVKKAYLNSEVELEKIGELMNQKEQELVGVNEFLCQIDAISQEEYEEEMNRIAEEFSPMKQYYFFLDKEVHVMTAYDDIDLEREQKILEASNMEAKDFKSTRLKFIAENSMRKMKVREEQSDKEIDAEMEEECMKSCMKRTVTRAPQQMSEMKLER